MCFSIFFYVNVHIYITELALNVACTDGGVPVGQCTDTLAECRDEGGFKCLCTAANFKGSSACEASKFDNKLCILYLVLHIPLLMYK